MAACSEDERLYIFIDTTKLNQLFAALSSARRDGHHQARNARYQLGASKYLKAVAGGNRAAIMASRIVGKRRRLSTARTKEAH